MGKGSWPRPGTGSENWKKNFDSIFKRPVNGSSVKKGTSKTRRVYVLRSGKLVETSRPV